MGSIKHCWTIKGCGREKGGPKVADLGECVASKEGLSHSCWAIAGTLCGGEVQGTAAQKEHNCMICEVYKSYHRVVGTEGQQVVSQFPDEEARYTALMKKRMGM